VKTKVAMNQGLDFKIGFLLGVNIFPILPTLAGQRGLLVFFLHSEVRLLHNL
jgi:hypothetical protein